MTGVELQPVAPRAGALGGDQCRAAAEEGIEQNIAASRAVEDRIGDHRHRFDRWMERQEIALLAAAGEGVGPGVTPDIAAISAVLAEPDVVAVRAASLFEYKHKLVLAAVERAHPAIVLDPNTEVFQLAVGLSSSRQQLVEMAPVHTDVVQRAVEAERGEGAKSLAEKGSEFGLVHLARGHREGAMVDRAEAARVTVDPYVVGRIGEDCRGAFLSHQHGEGRGIERAAA